VKTEKMANKDPLEDLVLPEGLELLDHRVKMAKMANKDLRDHQDHLVLQDHRDLLVKIPIPIPILILI
jgi:hypothetical protein